MISSENKNGKKSDAFSLIELLVVITILGVLSGIVLPALLVGKQRALNVYCQSNLHQLGVATLLYSDDDSRQSLSARQSRFDQNLNWLLPYAGATKAFSCPATKNTI